MQRVRHYGPTVVLLLTAGLVLILGPRVARQLAWASADAEIHAARANLKDNAGLAQLSEAFRNVARVVEPSVVHVQVFARRAPRQENPLDRFFGPRRHEPEPRDEPEYEEFDVPQLRGNGSGWVFDTDGHVVTNHHVIADADEIKLRFQDGSEHEATVVGSDPKTDIAVLKVENATLHPAARAGQPVEKGDIVFAFGSPFRFDFTVSQGIVSAKGRQLRLIESGYENFIQTDAAINPGNSGGPLTNIHGEVVGMNTAIASRTGAYNGLGFAIPVKMVQSIVTQLIEDGSVTRGYLGVYIEDLSPRMARTFGYEGDGGVLVTKPIDGGPAAKAGVQRGDIITHVNERPVDDVNALRHAVAGIRPGAQVPVTLFRNGKSLDLTIEVAALPKQSPMARQPDDDTQPEANPEAEHLEMLAKLGLEGVNTLTQALAAE
ncbi:MAG: trypsin-like peptidase domain-containing protein, partial [Phycisphaeraceae bacterium]|nr:trypsin-like peptidase domain-containing protein [Phycisphaeraceae bacterium]